MLLLAAAVIAAAPVQSRTSATVQATATIRIISAVVLKLDGSANADAPAARETLVRAADGSLRPLKVIEFQ